MKNRWKFSLTKIVYLNPSIWMSRYIVPLKLFNFWSPLGESVNLSHCVYECFTYMVILKNGQHHHEKLKFDLGLTCLVFSLEGTLNVVIFYLKYFNSKVAQWR